MRSTAIFLADATAADSVFRSRCRAGRAGGRGSRQHRVFPSAMDKRGR